MPDTPPPEKVGTLNWPIGKQVLVTGILIAVLLSALHVASRNEAAIDGELEPRETTTQVPGLALALPEFAGGWSGRRVLATTPELASAAVGAGAEAHLYVDAATVASELPTLDAESLVTAAPFEVIVIAISASRPPKEFARKVAANGWLYLLDADGRWLAYQEGAGMLHIVE